MSENVTLKNKDGKIYFSLNKKTKTGIYQIFNNSGQSKYCRQIKTNGFENLPSGFYRNNGVGLTGAGNYLFNIISDEFDKEIELTVSKSGKSIFNARGKRITLKINHGDLTRINKKVRSIKSVKNEEIRIEVRRFLGNTFKNQKFRKYKKAKPNYLPGELTDVLQKADIIVKLNSDDKQNLESFIPEYLSKIKVNLRGKDKLKIIFDSLDASKKVYFEKIIREFKKKLKQKNQIESMWQEFLSNYILVLKNTYGEILEKESVSLQGKYPDFMIIDPYGYLDIYEIKKPLTKILSYDKSRNNYFWDTEITKAISQVENYIHQVQKNSDALTNDIRKSKGIEVNIVRPRGFIIAGVRTQLINPKMIDDFRILNEALKNVDIIFYDDLLNNIESFLQNIQYGT